MGKRLGLSLAGLLIVAGATAAVVSSPSAHASDPVPPPKAVSSTGPNGQAIAQAAPAGQLCAANGGYCLNRSGGGTGVGTRVITYNFNDANNWFNWPYTSVPWCPSGYVHDGESGLFCPFDEGSGLNDRYHGQAIFELLSVDTGKCVTPSSLTGDNLLNILNNCGAQGYLWVASNVNNQTWVVNVGKSNYAYEHGGGSNHPWWLNQNGYRVQTQVNSYALNGWICYGNCS